MAEEIPKDPRVIPEIPDFDPNFSDFPSFRAPLGPPAPVDEREELERQVNLSEEEAAIEDTGSIFIEIPKGIPNGIPRAADDLVSMFEDFISVAKVPGPPCLPGRARRDPACRPVPLPHGCLYPGPTGRRGLIRRG